MQELPIESLYVFQGVSVIGVPFFDCLKVLVPFGWCERYCFSIEVPAETKVDYSVVEWGGFAVFPRDS